MRVLVVEDEIKMAALLKQGLEEQNHSVEVAHDGRAAVELASSYDFDVIVLDVMLPGLMALRSRAVCEVTRSMYRF